jgi:catalase
MYGSQTAQWVNARGETVWAKKHFRIVEPIQRPPLTHERTPRQIEARWYRGLARAIGAGAYPCWIVSVQAVPVLDAEHFGWNPFHAQRPWPFVAAPLHALGVLVLNRTSGTENLRRTG